MATIRQRSPPTSRARRTPAASKAGVLSPDALFDVLLRLPAKELCRLRAVCRSWRFLTIDPLFISAHAARHPSPLFLAKFWDGDDAGIHVMDLSGNVVKRIPNAPGHQLLCTRLDLACVATTWNSCSVLNPATGAAYALPQGPALWHHENLSGPNTFYAFGQVPSTGAYKVLRMFNRPEFPRLDKHQHFKVFTINGGASNAKWRVLQSRDFFVEAKSAIFIDRVVYFLMNGVYNPKRLHGVSTGIPADYIASLDIEREEWRRDLQGPISGSLVMDNIDAQKDYVSMWHQLTFAELKGSLVLAYHRCHQFILDLWFLTDFETGVWVKEYSIQTGSINLGLTDDYHVKPLLVLADGRLVICVRSTGLLFICDPQTSTFTKVEMDMGQLDSVGSYTGSLLSLQGGDMV